MPISTEKYVSYTYLTKLPIAPAVDRQQESLKKLDFLAEPAKPFKRRVSTLTEPHLLNPRFSTTLISQPKRADSLKIPSLPLNSLKLGFLLLTSWLGLSVGAKEPERQPLDLCIFHVAEHNLTSVQMVQSHEGYQETLVPKDLGYLARLLYLENALEDSLLNLTNAPDMPPGYQLGKFTQPQLAADEVSISILDHRLDAAEFTRWQNILAGYVRASDYLYKKLGQMRGLSAEQILQSSREELQDLENACEDFSFFHETFLKLHSKHVKHFKQILREASSWTNSTGVADFKPFVAAILSRECLKDIAPLCKKTRLSPSAEEIKLRDPEQYYTYFKGFCAAFNNDLRHLKAQNFLKKEAVTYEYTWQAKVEIALWSILIPWGLYLLYYYFPRQRRQAAAH